MTLTSVRARWAAAVALAASLVSCGPAPDPSLVRLWTDDFEIQLTADISPPRALERITYTVVVLDKNTREPIVNGEGRIFATNSDRKSIDNGLVYGPEVGTYRTTLMFITAGEWAMGFQFRRDSTQVLQRTLDWRQMVRNETSPTEDAAAAAKTP